MISLVDDETEVLEATAGLLRSLGYVVKTFASGYELLGSNDIVETECVIADVMMPGIDGFELQRRIALSGFRFPIIFLTAVSGTLARERLMSGGAFDVLSKPCSQQQLVNSLEAALDQYRRVLEAGRPPHT